MKERIPSPAEVWRLRKLIAKLSVNDFKKRYAASYMGVIWAFIQPLVTVVLYFLVFDVIFGVRGRMASGAADVPYVLFLVAGLAPWFYFSGALSAGTAAYTEYDYLVKKVVFQIGILPVVKIISALFVHLVFVVLMLAVAFIYGYYPTVYLLQLPYYMLCTALLSLALSYTTSALNVFARDFSEVISVLLQLGQWATPILWDKSMAPERFQIFIKLNPAAYIVNGYRASVYDKTWFFESPGDTVYFWCLTIALFLLGAWVFKRTRPHFPDLL